MIKVVIIGSGNVAHHLVWAFSKSAEIQLVQLYSRNVQNAALLADIVPVVADFNSVADADVYLIAVPDHAIESVATQLPFSDRLVAHTSGSVPMNIPEPKNCRGVFYPLQTFSKSREVDFLNVPICIESESVADYTILEKLAKSISAHVFPLPSEKRKALHIAAVFVNNFVNHLYKIGHDICQANDIPFEILQPLIAETASKIAWLSPDNSQTGPAKRHDNVTIMSHLEFLSDENQRNIYSTLTRSIQNHGKEL